MCWLNTRLYSFVNCIVSLPFFFLLKYLSLLFHSKESFAHLGLCHLFVRDVENIFSPWFWFTFQLKIEILHRGVFNLWHSNLSLLFG